jgi:hypothetical protein
MKATKERKSEKHKKKTLQVATKKRNTKKSSVSACKHDKKLCKCMYVQAGKQAK